MPSGERRRADDFRQEGLGGGVPVKHAVFRAFLDVEDELQRDARAARPPRMRRTRAVAREVARIGGIDRFVDHATAVYACGAASIQCRVRNGQTRAPYARRATRHHRERSEPTGPERMEAYAGEWLQLLIRWVHLITGIAWIGASFYFIWLDNSLRAPRGARDAPDAVGGELWAIHGGGFYHVQKYRIAPSELPADLHWFKWEAYWTWLSGFALLVVLYWWHADVYMIDRNVAPITAAQAVAMSGGLLVAGWVVYDQLCKRLGFAHERVLGTLLVLFIAAVAWALSHVFGGRALYLQIGA